MVITVLGCFLNNKLFINCLDADFDALLELQERGILARCVVDK
mgnify:FL=1